MAEQKPKDLESLLGILELRIQNLVCRFELYNVQFLDLRTRVELLETWRRQIQESDNSGSDMRDFISETTTKLERLGGMRKNAGSVYGSTKSKCWECGEVAVTVEAEQEVERLFTLVENLKERFTGVSPEHSLRELETKSRGTEYITQDLENPAYPTEVKEELVEDSPAQESCEKLEVSENLHKLEQQLLEGVENEEHFIKGTALLERHRVRGLGEGERKCECESTIKRNEMQGEIVGKEGKPDIRKQVGVGVVLMDETEEMLGKRGGQTDEILNDDCPKKREYSDDSECELIEEPKVERIGKEVIKNVEEKDVRIEKELDKWRKERKEALPGMRL